MRRWQTSGCKPLPDFAPYTAHVMTVQAFFGLCLGKGLITKESPSNQLDMAYLFYVPFCDVFVSGDRLHLRTAPPFLRANRRFVRSEALQADLSALDEHYSSREKGFGSKGCSPSPVPLLTRRSSLPRTCGIW